MRGFWGPGQGATTRNGATAQSGAVLSQEGMAPQRDAGASERGRGIPCAADPRFAGLLVPPSGAPHSRKLQRSHVPQKLCNSLHSDLTRKMSVKQYEILLLIITLIY